VLLPLWLDDTHTFPDPETAHYRGLVALGGDLACDRLLEAYRRGIFPWFGPEDPLLWWSPDPRGVLFPRDFHLSRSLLRTLRTGEYAITLDCAFAEVIRTCADIPRAGEAGTWIVPEMITAYTELHKRGYAHSVEVWHRTASSPVTLAGGCYGVDMGSVFCGESMFSRMHDGSKMALAALACLALSRGIQAIDCQFLTPHLASLGAQEIRRRHYLDIIEDRSTEVNRRDWHTWQAFFDDPNWPDKFRHSLIQT
jgi:leucyl/phenylalanyl-tRNA--protein transferase